MTTQQLTAPGTTRGPHTLFQALDLHYLTDPHINLYDTSTIITSTYR